MGKKIGRTKELRDFGRQSTIVECTMDSGWENENVEVGGDRWT